MVFLCPSEGGFDMPAIEIGRICVKLVGREAGRKCIIVDIMDKSFVEITGPKAITGIKRRRTNISHIEPLPDKITIKRGASDEEITEALKTAGKIEEIAEKVKPALASA
jgi:large subunit ribosomal protein L14e